MTTKIIRSPAHELQSMALFAATPKAAKRVLEFFTGAKQDGIHGIGRK